MARHGTTSVAKLAPTLNTAAVNGGTLTVTGTFVAPAAGVYVLEFFASAANDPEGEVLLGTGTVTAKNAGSVSFTYTQTTTITATYPLVTATLTDASGDTSAFAGSVTS